MSETLIIILASGVLLGAVSLIFARWRRSAVKPTDADREDGPVVPLLYVPQPRNTSVSGLPQGGARFGALPHPQAWPQPQPQPAAAGQKYLAPTSGAGVDGVVQLLPGRLVPTDGTVGQEIRFIKPAGESRFTFGRSTGPAHTHIQLLAPTASRMHAYMVMENGRWRIGNMSQTNQVLVNGAPLQSGEADRWLDDGDRIELGEVGFIFRER